MRQNPHVRICGGPGSATTLVYPTLKPWRAVRPPALGVGCLSSGRRKGAGADRERRVDDRNTEALLGKEHQADRHGGCY